MPTYGKCKNCNQLYYTAKNKMENDCQECMNEVKEITQKEYQKGRGK